MFVASFAAHFSTFALSVWLALVLNHYAFPRARTVAVVLPMLGVYLLLVGGLGFFKARRWGSRWDGAFDAGLATAAMAATSDTLWRCHVSNEGP
jgi:hypothetical protein